MPSADMSSRHEPRIVTLGDHTSTSLAYGTPVFAQSPCQSGSVRSSRSTSPEGRLTSASGDHSSGHGSITSSDCVLTQTGDLNVVAPYTVRNTFIDTTVGRPPSLDGFYDERQVRSCPPTRPSSYDLHDDSLLQMIESLVGKSAGKPPGLESTTSDAPYVVRNTFIDTTVGRSPSLDGFYEERQAWSCPPTRLTSVDEEHALSQLLGGFDRTIYNFTPSAMLHATVEPPTLYDMIRPPAAEPQKHLLLLQDALAMPELGSAELPTVGSRGHNCGTCRPCAFFHSTTCRSGVDCGFCHLCDAGEKKRRQRIKEEQVREAKKRQSTVFTTLLEALQGVEVEANMCSI